ncbi:MAG: DUF1272 domain-containing protein [Flavipsychrobacter sp.]
MLELRPICENCAKALPPNSTEAMICTYECTFCKDCVEDVLHNVCPNCDGGNFSPRPIRVKSQLQKDPAATVEKHRPVDIEKHNELLSRRRNVPPELR